jgi:hypothetical protein
VHCATQTYVNGLVTEGLCNVLRKRPKLRPPSLSKATLPSALRLDDLATSRDLFHFTVMLNGTRLWVCSSLVGSSKIGGLFGLRLDSRGQFGVRLF